MSDTDDRVIRIEDKLDKVNDRLSSIDSTLAAQHESLKAHMKRTEILENKVEPMVKQNAVVSFILKVLIAGGVVEVIARYLMKV